MTLNSEQLHDVFHDTRRDVLVELEKLFDKVDSGYGTTEYNYNRLQSGIEELQYALSLIKNIDL
jgi:hypothetical protein